MDEVTGQMVQRVDQERSTFGLAFERAKDFKRPIAIIAGKLTIGSKLRRLLRNY